MPLPAPALPLNREGASHPRARESSGGVGWWGRFRTIQNLPGLPMETRLTELEAKMSFAEDLIDSLNQTVFRQQEKIDLLERQIRLLHQQVLALQPDEERDLRDEIPPHY